MPVMAKVGGADFAVGSQIDQALDKLFTGDCQVVDVPLSSIL